MAPRDDKTSKPNSPDRKGGEPKGRAKRATGGKGREVTVALYDAMWLAYMEIQQIAHVSRTAGVTRACARRYIQEGDPERGLQALRFRLVELHNQTHKLADRSAAEDRAKLLKDCDKLQELLMERAKESILEVKDPARSLKALADIRLAVGKESDSGEGKGGSREALDALTDEQVGDRLLTLFARLGVVGDPKRSKRSPAGVRLAGPERKT